MMEMGVVKADDTDVRGHDDGGNSGPDGNRS